MTPFPTSDHPYTYALVGLAVPTTIIKSALLEIVVDPSVVILKLLSWFLTPVVVDAVCEL